MIWDIAIITIVVLLVGFACFYIWRSKKKGKKCIGCPYSGSASCHCNDKK